MINEDLSWILRQDEILKPLKEYPGYYVTNYGNVFSKIPGKKNFRQLKLIYRGNQYLVHIHLDELDMHIGIQRLVAKAFIENPYNYPFVRHKDGNTANNKVSNLEWVPSIRKAKKFSKIVPIITDIDSLLEHGEEAKPIVFKDGTVTKYYVTNLGKVIGWNNNKQGYFLCSPMLNSIGNLCVKIKVDKKIYVKQVNILVARAFIPNTHNYKYVGFIDGDSNNVKANNLYWWPRMKRVRVIR